MKMNENPFQDLIDLHNRYVRIEAKTAQIDKDSEEVEKWKKSIFEKFVEIENKSIPIPSRTESYISVLLEKVELRKKIRNEWGIICSKRVEMDKYSQGLEKILIERGGYNPNFAEKQEIELLIKQYEEISIKQESLLKRRIQIQEEEKSALAEIEKIISCIKY